MTLNVARLEQMAEWLDNGAPHVVFNMTHARESIAEVLDGEDEDEVYDVEIERDQKGLGSCGSVCCIAGYALEAWGTKKQKEELVAWSEIAAFAIGEFGLPHDERVNDRWMHHNLFDPALAPANCEPKQAAQAVRNCIATGGKGNPWDGVS